MVRARFNCDRPAIAAQASFVSAGAGCALGAPVAVDCLLVRAPFQRCPSHRDRSDLPAIEIGIAREEIVVGSFLRPLFIAR